MTYKQNIKTSNKKLYYLPVICIFLILSITLTSTTIQIFLFTSYSSLVFYLTTFLSLTLTFGILCIICVKFVRWFLKGKNYFILLYSILFAIYCCSILSALVYAIDVLPSSHPSNIKPTPPRILMSTTTLPSTDFHTNTVITYDLLFIISFILAWILTVMILKQYSRRIGQFKFWILVSLPLFFYVLHYGEIWDFLNLHRIFNLPYNITIPSSIGESIFITLVNSDIQMGGIFFGLSFLPLILKLKNYNIRNNMIITLIGMMLLFCSRDLYSIFVPSFPPGGVVTISFMVLSSFMLYMGLTSFIKSALKDRQFYLDLAKRIETDTKLLKNIIYLENEKLLMHQVKPLFDFSIKWEQEHKERDLTTMDINSILNDVLSELREREEKRQKVN